MPHKLTREVYTRLFAEPCHSYDGDDAPAKAEPEPSAQQDVLPDPPIESTTATHNPNQDSGPQMKDEDMYGNGQNGDNGYDGQENGGQTNHFNAPVEEEPHRIGIKEDG